MKSCKRFAVYLVLFSLLCSFMPTADAEESTLPNTEPLGTTEATAPAEEAAVLSPDASAYENDMAVVAGEGITFRLFNYSTAINKDAAGTTWRPLSNYFTFRNSSQLGTGSFESEPSHCLPKIYRLCLRFASNP